MPSPRSVDLDPPGLRDHDVAEEAQAHDTCGVAALTRGSLVSGARIAVSTGVIVRESEGSAVVAKYGIENLPHRQERAVKRAVRNNNRPTQAIGCIADEDHEALSSTADDVAACDP